MDIQSVKWSWYSDPIYKFLGHKGIMDSEINDILIPNRSYCIFIGNFYYVSYSNFNKINEKLLFMAFTGNIKELKQILKRKKNIIFN